MKEERLKLKKLLKELENIRGRHTELVSVYVPSGYNLVEISNQLFQEKSTASNIKDKTTRKNVLAALEKIIQHLRLFKKTPANGLVIFCGNISPVEGKQEIKLWSFEPPEKMKNKIYWCDQVFVLEPLKEMVREREVYGLIVLDAKEANIGLIKGKEIERLKHLESTVPSKTVKGGMSSARYDRIREAALNEFLTKVGEVASKEFLEQKDLKGVIIGGPGPVKTTFFSDEYLDYRIQKKVLGVKDISYTTEYGLEELVKKSKDLIEKASITKEKDLLEKFFSELQKEGKVTYDIKEVKKALEQGAVDTLLISEAFDWVHAKLKCECGFKAEMDLPREKLKTQTCEKCGKIMEVEKTVDLVDILSEKAEETGAKVELISTDTSEGIQFKELDGIGAFLRFKIT